MQIAHRVLDGTPDAERAFAALFGDRESAFWLDSSLVDPALSRFSFQGAALGGLGAEVRYAVSDRRVTATRGAESMTTAETLFDYLSRELARLHTDGPELPFALNGGFVGYLGYECKADCGAADVHAAAELPDAFLLLADRLLVIDHELERTHLLALSDATPGELGAAQAWLDATAARLDDLPALAETPACPTARRRCSSPCAAATSTTWRTSRPASGCSSPARATRSASPISSHCPRSPTRSRSTACCGASTRRPTARTCACARARC